MKLSNVTDKSIIKTENLEIGGNIFKYNRTVIQLSNISCFNVAPMPKTGYPTWAFVGALIGLILLFTKQMLLMMIGLIAIGFCVYEIYRITNSNNQLGEYLILSLNSGQVLYFSCYSKDFLYSVENVIADCFKNKNLKYNVNLKDCNITHQEGYMDIHNTGNIVTGNGNTVSAANTGNINNDKTIGESEWLQLENAFKELISKTDVNSKEHMLAVSAQYQICKKDSTGLRKIIEENINDFKNSIFSQMAGAGIIEIIKRITDLII